VVIVGDDPVAAAHVAIGIGRIQARHRRVAVADLVGEVGPLQSLVRGDDPHGIVDSFLYGVSLNKIARQVDDGGNLFVMPSGTEPVLTEDIFRNPRWRRLAGGFREVGALLLLVAPSSAAGVEALVASLDGAIIVGGASTAPIPAAQVLATITPPSFVRAGRAAASGTPRSRRVTRETTAERPVFRAGDASGGGRGWILPTLVAALLLALAGFWLTRTATRELRGEGPERSGTTDTASADAMPRAAALPTAMDGTRAADTLAVLVPADPADSAQAAAYGVLVLAANTEAGANAKLQDPTVRLPAATISPVLLGNGDARWFQVHAGAYTTPRQADSLLASLRARRALAPSAGSVVRAPFALLVERSVSPDAAKALAAGYAGRGIPVYALLQADGSARLYAGAFETPERAALLASTLRASGIAPTLVYRTGRVF